MTETPERAALLLYEAARLCTFDPAAGWPASLYLPQCAALLNNGWTGRYPLWRSRLDDAIQAGKLPAILDIVKRPAPTRRQSGSAYLGHVATAEPAMATKDEQAWLIERGNLGTWLAAIGETRETLNDHALAWLGPEWETVTPGNGSSGRRKPESETMQKRRETILKEWLDGAGKEFIERGKLALSGKDTWERLAKIKGELFRASAPATIEEFFKNQKLICVFRVTVTVDFAESVTAVSRDRDHAFALNVTG